MANVTDAAFRMIIAKYSKFGGEDIFDKEGKFTRRSAKRVGGPDVMYTEFVSTDGLVSAGREALMIDLKFGEAERPIVAQFFGATPEHFYRVALLARELGFDGIDINMGCPDRAVLKQGAGAALIEAPELAKKIISETKRGAGPLPVSVKTRLGLKKNTLNNWLPHLLEADLATIIVHGRTAKEMSLVPARWDDIAEAVSIRSKFGKTDTLLLGNGDVKDLADAESKAEKYGLDGVMVGRGIFGNPWFFADLSRSASRRRGRQIEHPDGARAEEGQPDVKEKLKVMLEHTRLFEEIFAGRKRFDVIKKHYKAYVNGFNGAKELRIKLMAAKNSDEVERIVRDSGFSLPG